jgi:O-methyltransferase
MINVSTEHPSAHQPQDITDVNGNIQDVRALYLELMKRCLLNLIYGDKEVIYAAPRNPLKRLVVQAVRAAGVEAVRAKQFDEAKRLEGRDWPVQGQTMLSIKRLDNIQYCVEQALADQVPGDLIETGVWRGGASILMRAILKAYSVTDRAVYVADSFAGLPPPDKDYPQDANIPYHTFTELAISLEEVQANFARYGLLDDQVHFLKGWFKDTLPGAPMQQLAVMRLDGDMYESTMDSLNALYPRLSVGGFVIIDDYVLLEPCRQAVDDYRKQHGITEEIVPIDFAGAYWRRERQAESQADALQ